MARGFQGMPGGNMQAMARQAQKLQQKMMETQAELEAREYEASAGGGVVTVAGGVVAVPAGGAEGAVVTVPSEVQGVAQSPRT